jgi:pyruvate formate lyase activating enzyme
MSPDTASPPESLEAKSPFELRVNQSAGAKESFVKQSIETGDVGFLHSFTTGSAVDGPGIRVVAWTAGCNWRCRYCHNPDTWTVSNGMAVPLERAVDELRKYRRGLQVMSGGFTLSGGEPLMQDRFAVRLCTAAKAMGVHTAIETNGYLGNRVSDAELDQIDLVLLGLKSWGAAHQELTGKDMGPTLDFAKRLAAR